MSNKWYRTLCPKPQAFPQLGTVPTSWASIRHLRTKRQLSVDIGREYNPYQYSLSKDYDRSGYGYGYDDHHSGYGADVGYGHSGYEYHDDHMCCPLVVDPLALCALLGFIAAGTYFLRTAVTMNMNIVGRSDIKSVCICVSSFTAKTTIGKYTP